MSDNDIEGKGYIYLGDDSDGWMLECWWHNGTPLYGRRINYGLQVYTGQFNGTYDPLGYGVYEYANGDIYEGDFKDNKKDGKGTFTFANGRKYEGHWKNDERHGKAKYTCKDGDYGKGEWVDGKPEGEHIYTDIRK
jgi:hypothetical protein